MGGGCETRELGWAGKARLQTRVASWASRRATGRLATRAEEPPGAREEACALLSGGHPQTLWSGVNFSTEWAELTLTQATTQTSLAPPREAKEARHERPQRVWLHLHETSRMGKPRRTESRSVALEGWGVT